MIIRRWGTMPWPQSRGYTNHSNLVLTSPPAVEPVTLADVKTFLRVTYSNEDSFIQMLIQSAREQMEQWLRRALITQSWDLILDWGPAWVELPNPPLISVDAINVRQLDQTEYLVPTNPQVYYVIPEARMVGLIPAAIWPVHITPWGWRCSFTCGYGSDPSSIPMAIKMGLMNMIGYAYQNRTTVDAAPEAITANLRPFRIEGAPWKMAKGVEPPELMS